MNQSPRKTKQQGVTLVELMIAITIGLIIIAGVLQLYATSRNTQKVQDGVARLQENARYAFARLSQDLSQTGFVGCFNYDPARITNTLAQEAGIGDLYDFEQPVDAVNGNGPMGTDTLIFRQAAAAATIPLEGYSAQDEPLLVDSGHANYGPLEQFQVVMVTDCSRAAVFMITNDPNTSDGTIEHATGVASPDGQSNVSDDLENNYGFELDTYPPGGSVGYLYGGSTGAHVFSIGDSAAAGAGEACSAATPQFCALFKNADELVQGVEDFQVDVGWIDAAGNLRYGEPTAAIDWSTVVRLKLTITLNSIEEAPSAQGIALSKKTFVKTIVMKNQFN
ncbi:MAG: hypothetical protein CL693_16115 [Cellvibrionaceae bacterium]|nr:hypothetical protein [Cellvibrionaceae bacterium]|tara:strand:- start:11074 stop:12081 length:1008 start_codon:yes stop_codon:yes gene_type:complete